MPEFDRLGEILAGFRPPKVSARPLSSPSSACPRCGGRGLILQEDRALRCPCTRELAISMRLQAAGLSPALQRQTFANFDLRYYEGEFLEMARRSLSAAQDFVRESLEGRAKRGLLFTGPVGSGKTFLACAIANALLAEGRNVFFVVVPDFLEAIRSSFNRTEEQPRSEIEERSRSAEILILDDLGAHNYTEWTRNTIYALLNYRLNHELPTVITTNLSLEQLEYHLGERTTSRILQHCRVYRLMVKEDIRRVRAARTVSYSSSRSDT